MNKFTQVPDWLISEPSFSPSVKINMIMVLTYLQKKHTLKESVEIIKRVLAE